MSIVLVLVFLSITLFLSELGIMQSRNNGVAEAKAFVLEKNYYKQLELKHAVMNVLSVEAGKSLGRKEALKKTGERLALLEEFFENNEDGFKVDFWCGAISSTELRELPRKMVEENETLKCGKCWDFSDYAVQADAEKKSVGMARKCASFIDVDVLEKRAGVSMGGLELTLDEQVQASRFSGRRGFGASILNEREGYAAIAFIPEGTWIEYD